MERRNYTIFLAIFLGTFFAMFGDTIPQSFQPIFIASLGVSPAIITLMYNIRNVIQTFLRFVAGTLSDSLGRRNMMLVGLALFAVVPFICSITTSPWLPVIAMLASGFALSIYFPPSEAYASSLFPPEKAGEAMGRYHMSWAISSVIGPSLGGALITFFPNYRTLFVLAGIITMTAFFIVWRYTEDDRDYSCPMPPGSQLRSTFSSFPSTAKRLLSNRKVFVASVSVFTHSFCHWGLVTFIPLFGAKIGMSEFLIGVSLTANALIIALSLPVVGSLSDRVGRFTPIISGLLVSVAAFALIPKINFYWFLPVINAVLGLCAVLVFPVSQAATMEALPPSDRGSATGVWGMVMSFGGMVGMFVMSGILSVGSIEWVFYACSLFTLGMAVVITLMRGYFNLE
jgi:DHA1 family multidrug resistance protein-like MFS transporter